VGRCGCNIDKRCCASCKILGAAGLSDGVCSAKFGVGSSYVMVCLVIIFKCDVAK
jgi:hypothetical protein